MVIPTDTTRGSLSTTRVPTTVDPDEMARREQTRAAAARYLLDRGHGDLLPVLGLDGADATVRRCAASGCDRPVGSYTWGCRYCSRECSHMARSDGQVSRPAVGRRSDRGPVRDDVVAELVSGRRPAVTVSAAELDAAIDALDVGRSAREVAERLGTTTRTVARRRAARRAEGGGA